MILLLAVIFAVLLWYKSHPYRVTSHEMRDAIERTLDKSMPEQDWLRLLQKRIRRDRYLDSVRIRLAELPRLIPCDSTGALYAPAEMVVIASLLRELLKTRAYDL